MAQDFKICRLCLSKTKIFFDLNDDSHSTILEAITAIKLDPLSSLETSVMCLKCRLNLRLAYVIQQNIIQSYSEFENVLESLTSSVSIKQEPDFDSPEKVSIILKTESPRAKAPFFCSVCHQQFSQKCSLYRHCRQKHSGDKYNGSFRCGSCTRLFRSEAALRSHVDMNHKKTTCRVCNKSFLLANYEKHLEIHKRDMAPMVCHFCGNSAKSKDSLRSHIRRYHLNRRKIYKCGKCDKLFRCRRNVVAHENSTHGGEPTEMCEICGKKFFSVETLKSHRKLVHLRTTKFTCEFCKKDYSSPYALKTHKRQHTNETPFRCESCGDGFRQRVSLKSHLRSKHNIHEEKIVDCGVCGKKFASYHALITHKRVHGNDGWGG